MVHITTLIICLFHSVKLCRSRMPALKYYPLCSADATSGVNPYAKPIPRMRSRLNMLFTKEAAANSAVECCPTMILSAKLTKMIPSWPMIMGSPRRSNAP